MSQLAHRLVRMIGGLLLPHPGRQLTDAVGQGYLGSGSQEPPPAPYVGVAGADIAFPELAQDLGGDAIPRSYLALEQVDEVEEVPRLPRPHVQHLSGHVLAVDGEEAGLD